MKNNHRKSLGLCNKIWVLLNGYWTLASHYRPAPFLYTFILASIEKIIQRKGRLLYEMTNNWEKTKHGDWEDYFWFLWSYIEKRLMNCVYSRRTCIRRLLFDFVFWTKAKRVNRLSIVCYWLLILYICRCCERNFKPHLFHLAPRTKPMILTVILVLLVYDNNSNSHQK